MVNPCRRAHAPQIKRQAVVLLVMVVPQEMTDNVPIHAHRVTETVRKVKAALIVKAATALMDNVIHVQPETVRKAVVLVETAHRVKVALTAKAAGKADTETARKVKVDLTAPAAAQVQVVREAQVQVAPVDLAAAEKMSRKKPNQPRTINVIYGHVTNMLIPSKKIKKIPTAKRIVKVLTAAVAGANLQNV